MFTINIRDIVAVGKSRMKWNIIASNSKDVANTTSLIDLLLNEANEQKRDATISEAIKDDPRAVTKGLANFIETSKLVSDPADREKHDAIIMAIQDAQKVALDTTKTTSQTLASSPNTATVEAAKLADAKLDTSKALVQKETVENIDGLKVDMVMTKLFQLDSSFFKGEITRVEKFQELITVVASCLNSGTTPKTEKEWVKLGYSGQNVFEWGDAAELAVVNNFLANVQNNPKNAALVQYIATHAGNNESAYKTVLNDLNKKTLSIIAKNETSDTLSVKDGKIEKSQANSRIDALLGNDQLWSGLANRDDIKASIMRASLNGKTLDVVYKRITGQSTAPDWTDDRAVLTASVEFRYALNARMAIMSAIGSGNAGLDSVLQGKEEKFAKAVQDYVKQHGEIKIEALDKNINSTLINSLSGILGVAVAFGTAGVVTLRARGVEDITSDDILQKLLKDPKVEGADKGILGWVANLFVGRRFDLAIGNTDSHDAMRERLLVMARKIQGITKDTSIASITDLGLRTGFVEAQKIGLLDKPEGVKAFQKYLLEQTITNEALSEKDNIRWSASLNPLFAGIHRDGVSVDQYGSITSQANKIESESTAKEVPLEKLGITRSIDGKKFTIPTSIKDADGVYVGDIPVVIKNVDGKLDPVTQSTIKEFQKPQSINIALITNNSAPVFVISFKEAITPIVAAVAAVEKKTIDVNNKSMTDAAESARAALGGNFIDNITIRTKFAKLQAAISTISNEKEVDTVFASLEKSPQLKLIFEANKDKGITEKYAVLLSILGEFAGDQRYRKVRLYQKDPTLLDNKKEMAYLRPLLHTIIGGTAAQVMKMTDAQIKDKIAGLTMSDITRVTVISDNEKFENTEMEKLGLTGVDSIRNSYREQDKTNKVYTDKIRTTEGFGFMMNHQVLGKKVTFAGVSALAPEMQVRDIAPIDVTSNMDKSKFINRLNTLQIARITIAINTAYPLKNYSTDDIRTHLDGSKPIESLDVSAKFYYAQFPNCTNDVLFMKIEGKGPTGTPIVVDMKGVFGTSTVTDAPVVRTNELDAGVNLAAVLAKELSKKEPGSPNPPNQPNQPMPPTDGTLPATVPATVPAPAPAITPPSASPIF